MKLAMLAALVLSFLTPQAIPASPAPASKTDALTSPQTLTLAPDRLLVLEPGIRAIKTEFGYSLATYDGAKVDLVGAGGPVALLSPAPLRLSAKGWDLGNGTLASSPVLTARRHTQDDTDTNLKSMQESARKLKEKNELAQKNAPIIHKFRVRWLYQENPNPTSELFNSQAIQQLTHVSPIGF